MTKNFSFAIGWKPVFIAILAHFSLQAATVPSTVHPSWTKINLRPTGFQPGVGGLGFLSDGRLVVDDWGGDRDSQSIIQSFGKIYFLSGVQGDNPNVTMQTFATGLEDPLGMAVVHDTIYVCGGQHLVRLIDTNHDGVADRKDTIFTLPGTPPTIGAFAGDSLHPQHGRAEWMFGMLVSNDTFYINPSSLDPSATGSTQINPYRGTHIAVTANGTSRGKFEIVNTGLRAPSGLGIGPSGMHCVSDNQGEWLPTNKLICLQPGKYYGAKHGPGGVRIASDTPSVAETPATVLIPEDLIGNSATQPLLVPSGLYAGQMLMGDVKWGGIQRYFLEKNNAGDFQGCVFVFTGGLEAGVNRMVWGPDGMLYLGMIGGGSDGVFNNQKFGLQKLKFNGDTTFEMLAVRARPGGMEIEFTKPVDTTTAKLATSYQIQTYYFVPSTNYGGSATGTTTLTPGAIQISPDRKKVYLPLSGLVARTTAQPQRVVYIKLLNVKSATGATPWTPETWYTMNALGTGTPFDLPITSIDPAIARNGFMSQLRCGVQAGNLVIQTPFHGSYEIRIRDVRGSVIASFHGEGGETKIVSLKGVNRNFVLVEAIGEGMNLRRTVMLP